MHNVVNLQRRTRGKNPQEYEMPRGPPRSISLSHRRVTPIAQEEKSGQRDALTAGGGVAHLQVQEAATGLERDKESHNGRQFENHKSTSIYLATPEV